MHIVATFTVMNANDSGAGSLRQAIADADAAAGADTIVFDASVFDSEAGDVIRLTSGQITITDAAGLTIDGGPGVTITGDAAGDDTVVDSVTDLGLTAADRLDDNTRIFEATAGALTLEGLTLTGGRTTASFAGGGAVRAAGALTMIDSMVSGNSTAGYAAGGGGVFAGDLTLIDSVVLGNSTAGLNADGGGVFGGSVTLIDSTIASNSTAGVSADGGGVYGSGAVTLTNSTVSGNSTAGVVADGGGVFGGGPVILTNTTVSGNSTTGLAGEGGGVFGGGGVTLTDSIVLGNVTTFEGVGGDEAAGVLTLTGGNILGNGAGGANVFSGATDVGDTTAAAVFAATTTIAGGVVAGALADNGGPAPTIALKADAANPALDAATGGTVAADARGVAAVDLADVGSAGSGAAVRDLGAFEVERIPETPSLVVTTAADVVDAFDGLTSLREAVAFANATAGADTITFDATVFDGGRDSIIRLTLGEMTITDALTIDGGNRVVITGDRNGDDVTDARGVTDVFASRDAGALDDNAQGLFNADARTTLDGLILTGGFKTGGNIGGALVAGGGMTIIDSTVAGNAVDGVGIGFNRAVGGGVYVRSFFPGFGLTAIGSTFSGNAIFDDGQGSNAGAAIYGVQSGIRLINSTVAFNRAEDSGANAGGAVTDYRGNVYLEHSTITGNSLGGPPSSRTAAGINRGTNSITNSIVSGNYTPLGPSDISGTATRIVNSIIGGDGFSLFADPVLATRGLGDSGALTFTLHAGALGDNGGPTQTVMLAPGSRALDIGASGIRALDQRGVARPVGDGPDAGAVERRGEAPSLIVTTAADNVDDADGLTSLREAIAYANTRAGADTITFDADVFNGEAADIIRLTRTLRIGDELVIDGGATGVVISGDAAGDDVVDAEGLTLLGASQAAGTLADNVRLIGAAESAGTLTLRGLTLTGGFVQQPTPLQEPGGGAVSSLADLTLDDVTIAGNGIGTNRFADQFSTGAAIMVGRQGWTDGVLRVVVAEVAATLTVTDSVIRDNGVALAGNAPATVLARGETIIQDSVVRDNIGVGVGAGDAPLSIIGSRIEDNAGGGVAGRGVVSVTDSVVSGNTLSLANLDSASGLVGAGVRGGAVTVLRSTVSDNVANGFSGVGAGVYGRNSATVIDSAVLRNGFGPYEQSGRGGATGGGIGSPSAVTVINSTVADNFIANGGRGGGVGVGSSLAPGYDPLGYLTAGVTISGSTITGNTVAPNGLSPLFYGAAGGGVFGRIASITDSIIVGNSALTDADATLGAGNADSIVTNSLIGGDGRTIFAETRELSIRTVVTTLSDDDGFAVTDENGDPVLVEIVTPNTFAGVVADNGGPVATVALRANAANPALDAAGDGATGPDARGVAPVDLPGVGGDGVGTRDIGAFELNAGVETPSLVVTTTADVVDPFDNQASLREAVAFANLKAGADEITFAPSLFEGGAAPVIRLTGGQITVSGALTIAGGPQGVTITGDAAGDDVTGTGGVTDVAASLAAGVLGDNSRLFDAPNASLTLQGLTLTGGRTTAADAAGGAVRAVGGSVTLTDSLVAGNSTAGDRAGGGGVWANTLTLTDSAVIGNATAGARAFGGGVVGGDLLTITDSVVSNNRTEGAGAVGGGAAAYAASITRSAVTGNVTQGADASGGGVFIGGQGAITNSTIHGNTTAGTDAQGGGLYGYRVSLTSLTVSGNRALAAEGGGLSGNAVTLTDSIVLGNLSGVSGRGEIGAVALTAEGLNIVGANAAAFAATGATVVNADPAQVFAATTDVGGGVLAGVIADNGGPAPTVALNANAANLALDASAGGAVESDARGVAAVDLPGVGAGGAGGAVRDLGAFEVERLANRAPAAGNDSAATAFETAVVIDALGNDSDPDGDPLAIAAVTQGANGTVAIDDNGTPDDATDDRLVYTPDAGFSGEDVFSYTVADGRGGAALAQVTVAVAAAEPDASITFQYLVAREITGITGRPGSESYRTAEFSAARSDVTFEDLVFDPRPDPSRVGDLLVGGSNNIRFREFFAVLNDGGDPGVLDAGDHLYRVSNAGSDDRLTTIPFSNNLQDVVTIRASGVLNANALGSLDLGVRFGDRGFGLDNGPDGESEARWLNRGDTLVFRLTGADGVSDDLDVVSFTVRTDRPSADIGFDADRDGRLLFDTNGLLSGGFVEDGGDVFLRGVANGARVEVDFGEREVRVNGQSETADFRGLFDDPGRIGLGASLNGGRWALDDLTLGLA
jgi:CSLREA domain-containing protein